MTEFHCHYMIGVKYTQGDTGWEVTAVCGAVLRSSTYNDPRAYVLSERLEDITCEGCKEYYSLEFLAEVP